MSGPEIREPTPEEILEAIRAEWPSGLSAQVNRALAGIADLRRELAAARATLAITCEELGRVAHRGD